VRRKTSICACSSACSGPRGVTTRGEASVRLSTSRGSTSAEAAAAASARPARPGQRRAGAAGCVAAGGAAGEPAGVSAAMWEDVGPGSAPFKGASSTHTDPSPGDAHPCFARAQQDQETM
jgi:hypothetical protein